MQTSTQPKFIRRRRRKSLLLDVCKEIPQGRCERKVSDLMSDKKVWVGSVSMILDQKKLAALLLGGFPINNCIVPDESNILRIRPVVLITAKDVGEANEILRDMSAEIQRLEWVQTCTKGDVEEVKMPEIAATAA